MFDSGNQLRSFIVGLVIAVAVGLAMILFVILAFYNTSVTEDDPAGPIGGPTTAAYFSG